MDEPRFIDLEIKIAYQDDLLQTLNDMVRQQQQQIDRLETTCYTLNERLKGLSVEWRENQGVENNAYEIPPHY